MESKETQNTFADSVNDTIDVILDEPLRALGQLVLPILCFAVVFGADAVGLFDGVFPDAGWGLVTMMGAALYAFTMVVKMYATGKLFAPESGNAADFS